MLTTTKIMLFILCYLLQAMIAASINIKRPTRIPNSTWDFIKLTFAPYVIYCRLFNDKKLD
jgi:hypothetical protein